MIPTGQQVADFARITYLGESEVPGGQIFTDTVLQPAIGSAYRTMFSQMMRLSSQRIRRYAYYVLPAYTTRIIPAALGLANMGEVKGISERNTGTSFAATIATITPAAAGTPDYVDLTVTGHGLATGTQVVAFNFTDTLQFAVNDLWYVTVVDANTLRLLGCSITGSTGGTGVIATGSGQQWPSSPNMVAQFSVSRNNSATNVLQCYDYSSGYLNFPPCTQARQIQVLYQMSGSAPDDLATSLGIDNCMDFLACHAAGLAASGLGYAGKSEELFQLSVGTSSGDAGNGDAGLLNTFLQPDVRAAQNIRVVLPRFRQKRNTGFNIPY